MHPIGMPCIYTWIVATLVAIVSAVIFLIRLITKKNRKTVKRVFWIANAVAVGAFVLYGVTSPITRCDHEFTTVIDRKATCTVDGRTELYCPLCDFTKKKTSKATGHNMVTESRREPTYEADGELVEKCSVCGYEVVTSLEMLIKENQPTETEPITISEAYNDAVALIDAGKFDEAISLFEAAANSQDDANRIGEMRYLVAQKLLEKGATTQAAMMFGRAVGYEDAWGQSSTLWNDLTVRKTLVASGSHTVGLNSNGTVVAVGWNYYGQCDVHNWTNIIDVSAGGNHTVGLKSDGTVVAVGGNSDGQCDVSDWTNIVAVSANGWHTVGLKADGTVVAVGDNDDGQCNVSSWTDIVAISAGGSHTVGLKSDGTVVVAGSSLPGQDFVAVSAGYNHTVGLKSDGTVVAAGNGSSGQCDVTEWEDIVTISAGDMHTVGLKSDGTVVAVGYNDDGRCNVSSWTGIVAISAGGSHTVGLKSDGSVVVVGIGLEGQCDVSGWNLSDSENRETQISSKYCVVCKGNAQYSYTNPFSGVEEPYCYTHYKEIKDTLQMMEDDVNKSSHSNQGSNTNSYSGSSARHTDSEAFSCAKAIVKSRLKSPSTAKFCWITDATIKHLGNGEYMVTGWVEAQNSFGATLRQTFVVVYTATESGYKNADATLY